MCGNSDVGNPPKAICHNSSHFEAIEVLPPHLCEYSLQRVLDLCPASPAQEHHLHFIYLEKEVSAGGTDLLIEGKAIKSLNHAPIP